MEDMVKSGIKRAKEQDKGYAKFSVLGTSELNEIEGVLKTLEGSYEVITIRPPNDEAPDRLYDVVLDMHSIK
ncbi:hypothetical protein M4L90_12275 [Staphylococcus equorum]|uniref:Uncharacterized protein n=1 Tax=Staphylococcus equorum TaxID=246432 RepID=A0A9X4L6R6_9STAP|nr:hypothetical protein [Staphylococcus equorum]MDG0820696.1 hypothetical protein [Staphylococcus equorum]MDG0841321.1 hypothetical protein [Staphylococcus equorum]MDG0847021.1 hypothetical protein [Staphylococcus equorum]PTE82296.1 hypothetical protein BUY85_00735 [Staphylococcus equorum]